MEQSFYPMLNNIGLSLMKYRKQLFCIEISIPPIIKSKERIRPRGKVISELNKNNP